jgi:hypothetical protein
MAGAVALLALLLAPAGANAQQATRINDDQVKNIISRLESAADTYRSRLDAALDDSAINGTKKEDRANKLVQRFEESTDRLKGRFDDDNAATGAARTVLENAAKIDKFMQRNGLDAAQDAWLDVRNVLDDLALAYNVAWTWNGEPAAVERVSDDRVDSLLERVEARADRFRASLDAALDASAADGTNAEDEINRYVQDFERATDKWKSHFNDKNSAARDAEEVLKRAQSIDDFMISHRLTDRAQADWAELRTALDELARAYNVTWQW